MERALINRINHYMYSTEFFKINQYGFNPQKSTIDAIMALIFLERFKKGEITANISWTWKGRSKLHGHQAC